MNEVNASIITIGDELLIGQTIDTNSAFIAQELNRIGVWVKRRVAIADDRQAILDTLADEAAQSRIIIITGGLGPTADDITKPTLCDYFGTKLVVDEGALQNVTEIFRKLGRPMIERNAKQAEVPESCTVLPNLRGTAPGMWFEAPPPPKGGSAGHSPLPMQVDNDRTNLSKIGEHTDAENLPEEDQYEYMTADPFTYGLLREFVKANRSNSTEAEDALWQQLRGKQLAKYKFRRQHIIGKYIADFVCLPERLIIEVDGLIHQLPSNRESDEERIQWLASQGYHVIRFTNEQVLHHLDDVLNKIFQELKNQREKNDMDTSEAGAAANPLLGGGGAGQVVYVSLPGVPHEMKGLMTNSVIPKIKETFTLPAVVHKTLLTAGQGESFIAERLVEFEAILPPFIKLAYLPAYGMVRLRLTGRGADEASLTKDVSAAFDQLKDLVQEWLVADEDASLPEAVSRLLKENRKTLSTAESCTGGYIAHLITSLQGSSAIYKGSVVSYANAVKQTILGVKEETLREQGAVSEQTVLQMAAGACAMLQTDFAVATSGIMGPDGGSADKPVGTVWIAVANKAGSARAQKFHFRFDRERNIELTANAALMLLRNFVLEDLAP
jgi:PncC family amidohydrolase